MGLKLARSNACPVSGNISSYTEQEIISLDATLVILQLILIW